MRKLRLVILIGIFSLGLGFFINLEEGWIYITNPYQAGASPKAPPGLDRLNIKFDKVSNTDTCLASCSLKFNITIKKKDKEDKEKIKFKFTKKTYKTRFIREHTWMPELEDYGYRIQKFIPKFYWGWEYVRLDLTDMFGVEDTGRIPKQCVNRCHIHPTNYRNVTIINDTEAWGWKETWMPEREKIPVYVDKLETIVIDATNNTVIKRWVKVLDHYEEGDQIYEEVWEEWSPEDELEEGTYLIELWGNKKAVVGPNNIEIDVFALGQKVPFTWWNSSWGTGINFTIDHNKIDSNLTNKVLTAFLNDTIINYSKTQDAGQDIRVTDEYCNNGGSELAHAIEIWNESGGSIVHFVASPSSTTNMIGCIYYDNPSAADNSNAADVWIDYESVWLLNKSSGTLYDALGNHDGTAEQTPTFIWNSQIDGGYDFDPDDSGNDDAINTGDWNASSEDFTITAWVNLDSNIRENVLISKYDPVPNDGDSFIFGFGVAGNNDEIEAYLFHTAVNFTSASTSSANLATDTWYHVGYVCDYENPYEVSTFKNGVFEPPTLTHTDGGALTIQNNSIDMRIGRRERTGTDSRGFDGTIDYVTFAYANRTEAWMKAEYYSGMNNLIEYGSEITYPVGNYVVLNSPSDGSTNTSSDITFQYTPQVEGIFNSSVYGNWSGGWHLNTSNSTDVTSDVANIITVNGIPDGDYIWNVGVWNDTDEIFASSNYTITINVNSPATITGLEATAKGHDWILWEWTNPSDADFNYTSIYVNGTFMLNTSNNWFIHPNIDNGTSYEIQTQTVDISGIVNTTWANNTATTYNYLVLAESFVDDYRIASMENLERNLSRPDKYSGNPVMEPSSTKCENSWCDKYVEFPSPRYYNGSFHLHFLGCNSSDMFNMFYTTSTDGYNFVDGAVTAYYGGVTMDNQQIRNVMLDLEETNASRRFKGALRYHGTGYAGITFSDNETNFIPSPHLVIDSGPVTEHQTYSLVKNISSTTGWILYAQNLTAVGRGIILFYNDTEVNGSEYIKDTEFYIPPESSSNQRHGMNVWIYGNNDVYYSFMENNFTADPEAGTDQGNLSLWTSRTTEDFVYQEMMIVQGPPGSYDYNFTIGMYVPVHYGEEWWMYYEAITGTYSAGDYTIALAKIRYEGIGSINLSGTNETGTLNTTSLNTGSYSNPILVINTNASGKLEVELTYQTNGSIVPGYERGNFDNITGDNISKKASWDGHSKLPINEDVNITFYFNGTRLYSFKIYDSDIGETAPTTEDSTPPNLDWVPPTANNETSTTENQTYIPVNFSGNEDIWEFKVEANGTNTSCTSNTSIWCYYNNTELNSNQTRCFYGWARDLAGNWNNTEYRCISTDIQMEDMVPPDLDFVEPSQNDSWVNTNYIFVNVSSNGDALSSCAIRWNGTNESMTVSGDFCYINKTGLPDGNYWFVVYANDTSDNWNETGERVTKIDTVTPYYICPRWGDSVESPTDPAAYVEGQLHNKSSCWFDDDSGLDTVLFVFDYDPAGSKSWVNSTADDMGGGVYNGTAQDLEVGYYDWYFWANDSAGNVNNTWVGQTYEIQKGTPTITLYLNGSDSDINASTGSTINHTVTLGNSGTVSLYRNDSLMQSGSAPLTNLTTYPSEGTYEINASYDGNDNYTYAHAIHYIEIIEMTYEVLSESYQENVTESEYITISITLATKNLDDVESYLVWNGTNYSYDSKTGDPNITFSKSFYVPSTDEDTNVSFHWELTVYYPNGTVETSNTTSHNQTVFESAFEECTGEANETETLVLYLLDEENSTYIIGDIDLLINASISNISYQEFSWELRNQTNFSICMTPVSATFTVNATLQYWAEGYEDRNYFLTDAELTNETQDLNLYLLLESDGEQITLYLKDSNEIEVEDAIIKVRRFYIGNNSYKTVSMVKTDFEGKGSTFLRTNDVWYSFLIERFGSTVKVYSPSIVTCLSTPCTLTLYLDPDESPVWDFYGEIEYNCSVNQTGKTVRCTVNDPTGLMTHAHLKLEEINPLSIDTVCDSYGYSSSVTTVCDLDDDETGDYRYSLVTAVEGYNYNLEADYVDFGSTSLWGNAGLFLGFVIVAVLSMMFIKNPVTSIIGGIVGTIVCFALGTFEISLGAIIGLLFSVSVITIKMKA